MAGFRSDTGHRVVAWNKHGMIGAEFALIDFAADSLRAEGFAIGFEPEPYRLEYTLQQPGVPPRSGHGA